MRKLNAEKNLAMKFVIGHLQTRCPDCSADDCSDRDRLLEQLRRAKLALHAAETSS